MDQSKKRITKKQVFILGSTILLTILYYFTSLYRIHLPADAYIPEGRNSILFFQWVFGGLFNGSPWIDFWQYIWQFCMSLLLFLFVPMLLIKYYLKEKQRNYGFQWGDKRFNLIWTLIGLAVLPAFFFLKDPSLTQEYPLTWLVRNDITLFIVFNLVYFIYYIGFEFIFRAYLQFGLKREEMTKLGIFLIIIIQTIITTAFHIGKPFTEIIAAAAVGPIFGYLTLRGKSFIWPVLIFHYLIGVVQNIAPLI
ncbi:MAG: CPBP family glutamic-type intramembrane protease [Candidatus Helarchaeota archaeon]|nr:CPBP family glutamic-type intramembrane protease [Candidatus Helarchaeota archaeon]